MSAGDIILKSAALIAKFNPYHSPRNGQFTNGRGGAPSDKNMSGGAKKPKTQAQKNKELDSLSDAEYARYSKAPKSMDHDAAMAYARGEKPKAAKVYPSPVTGKPTTRLSEREKKGKPKKGKDDEDDAPEEEDVDHRTLAEIDDVVARSRVPQEPIASKKTMGYILDEMFTNPTSRAKVTVHGTDADGAAYITDHLNRNFRVWIKDGMRGTWFQSQLIDTVPTKLSEIKKGNDVNADDVIAKAHELIAKFNPYHSRTNGQFTNGPGGGRIAGAPMRTASMDGLRNAAGGGSGKPKTKAQKDKEVAELTGPQYKRYSRAPGHMDHDAAMAYARAGNNAGRPAKPKATEAAPKTGGKGPKNLVWPDPGKQPGDGGRSYDGMRKATKEERINGIKDADGNLYRIPGNVHDAWVSTSPHGRVGPRGGAIMAQWAANDGKIQQVATKAHNIKASAEKFDRVAALAKKASAIDKKIKPDIEKGDERAIAVGMMRQTGMRVGSKAGGGKSVKRNKETGELTVEETFGILNLQRRHVTIKPNGDVRLQFTGKSGMSLDTTIKGPRELTTAIKRMMDQSKGKASTTPIFSTTTSHTRVLSYTKTVAGNFKNHDFRTLKANVEAARIMASMPKPTTEAGLKAARNAVGKAVGAIIGDTPKVTLEKYINGAVFTEWENGVQV